MTTWVMSAIEGMDAGSGGHGRHGPWNGVGEAATWARLVTSYEHRDS